MYLTQAAKLAWANTTNQWQRLFVRCAGITFAVVLMFMQTGFRNALFDSNVRVAEKMNADIIIRTRTRFMLSSGQNMSLDEIVKARSVTAVKEAQPLYIETRASYFRKQGQPARRVRVVAFEPSSEIFSQLGVGKFAAMLETNQTAVMDTKSKPIYHLDDFRSGKTKTYVGELSDRTIELVGRFELGIDFTNDGNLVMTPRNFAAYFPHRGRGQPLSRPDYGLIKVDPNANTNLVIANLKTELGPHVLIDSKQDFVNSERKFWGTNTPIGLIFMVGTIIGFVVGLIICYQVLATDIGDQMSEFATLKAMGYSSTFFTAVVVFQALILSLLAFVPGMLITLTAFAVVNASTGLLMYLNVFRISVVLSLTMLMCVLSGVIALRRLLAADPASLF